MSRYHYAFTEAKYKRFLKEGRGQGEGDQYLPWSHRVPSWKVNRLIHLLSNLELRGFFVAEWDPLIIDIREQYPLPFADTMEIARQRGFRHPVDPHTRYPWVMTTDLLLTWYKNGERRLYARTIKYASELRKKRTLEKLEIERRYWKQRNVNWGIWTEQTIPKILVRNVAIVHQAYFLPDFLDQAVLFGVAHLLTSKVQAQPYHSLSRIGLDCDKHLSQPFGTSLRVAYYLIATRQWCIDMHRPLHPSHPLTLLGVDLRVC
jgi:hypothetical protein